MKEFTIVGAGLVGALQSVFLAKKGHKVTVYERRPDMRTTDVYQGRSINLALSNRGWRALEKVGISEDIRTIAIPMYRRTMHDVKGNLTHQPYGREGEAIYSVSRGELNRMLLDLADRFEETSFSFGQRCIDIDLEGRSAKFKNEETGQISEIAYKHLIGTDGAFSAVRHRLMFNDRFDYAQDYIAHGYKELSIEPAEDGTHRMEKNALHIWPREDFMLIALPNTDGSFTCTLFLAWEGAVSFAALKTERDVIGFFQYYFPDVLELEPDVIRQFMQNPSSSLVTVKCYPWNYKDSVLLMGDAAHAVVPFYGQGMNAGFEDCTIFDRMLDAHDGNFEQLFDAFSRSRKPDADAVAELALRNFIEMRDLTGDAGFLLRKKIEGRFYSKYPDKWTPLYSMVTFLEFPYAEALREGQRHDRIMEQVMQMPGIHDRWDSEEVEQKILSLL